MHPLRRAAETEAIDEVQALLAENVVFVSPVAFSPYTGRDMVSAILRGVYGVFEDFRYEKELGHPNGRDYALIFKARVGDREIHGCDLVHHDENGLIDEFTVMVRPLSAVNALASAMRPKFALIEREAGIA
ncbi:nuclear transport factor 2 family protein [Actinomadura sp. SCN-SB]|uniref:nuclear transport factor 2 family protein n=1 Tax=Actinomadura sp. SCN-SB TaxID=3373092 RepID=UPI0037533771